MSKKKKKKKKRIKREEKVDYDFDPHFSKKAKLEIKVTNEGVSFVGNSEGYLSLSRFFTYLAEVHTLIREESPKPETNTVQGYGAYHFKDYVPEKKIQQGDYMFRPGPISSLSTDEHKQDVLFWLSDVTGPEFWLEDEGMGKKKSNKSKNN
ncbi:hypothetical protein [Planococcus sp. CPCC 101016]|uniref:hypothetical protein n=1 Tax=Planococcus sp. CPCC 101016 TaxID=2599617 RepID=UPI0021BD5307|nr:hypothetical protein [Planococcus sp. CPCC 101016]